MSTHLLLLLALTGPEPPVATAGHLSFTAIPWSGDELRASSRAVVSRSRSVESFDAARDVPELLQLRAAVLGSEELSRSERIQTRNRLDYCLEQALERLQRRKARLDKLAGKTPSPAKHSEHEPAWLGGGASEAAQAQQLIDLIEATIQPESWANNGGLGTIRYWSPGYALVIRNTQAVHAEIGGLIGTLEAQQR